MSHYHIISQGCLNCAMGMILKFFAYVGLPYILTCDHRNGKAKTNARFSKFHFIVSIVVIMIISCSNYYCIKRINNTMKKNYLMYDLLLMTSDLVFYAISVFLPVHLLYNSHKVIYFLEFMENFMMKFEKSNSRCLFSIDDILGFRIRIYVYLILLSIANASAAVFLFCFEVDSNWNTIEKIGLFLCMYVGTFCIVTGMIMVRILFRVGDKYKNLLKMDLENLINYRRNPTEEIVNGNNICISMCETKNLLKIYSEAYLGFICAFKQMNHRCNPLLLTFILLGIIFFVITIFMIILLYVNEYPISVRFVSVQIGMQFILVAMAACFVYISKCGFVNDEILTYLYKFPISKLELSERLQFESLLLIVKRLKIKMEASQIVEVDMSLFASILTTVLTYVLVAVQFEFL